MSSNPESGGGLGIARVFPVFTLAFAAVYFFGIYTETGPIHYYPAVNEFHLSPQPASKGPVMMWYGWIVNGCVAGVLASGAALAFPKAWFDGPRTALVWLAAGVPAAMLIALVILLRQYFLV